MRLLVLSDLHLEFSPFVPPTVDADVVILAGDIDVGTRGLVWAQHTFSCPVLYVAGNHEYYGGHLGRTLEKLWALQTPRVQVLERDEVVIEGVRFLGTTAWTDYTATGNAARAQRLAQTQMSDFRRIRTADYRRVRPIDFLVHNFHAKTWLQQQLARAYTGPTVVITHHAPSLTSLKSSLDAGTDLDAAYTNCWDDLMGDAVQLWVHGHVHTAADYVLAGTRVLCNPRGYPGETTGFDPGLLVTV
ncbi:metallophosphoesterase [Pseudomonas putida]|uniref:metallophosphoesterase n=1 Tax=Pseudomonas putida TaxID=303 RepID=UPI0009020405|nr:metallophosphoesterase [Pseudomonas putida]APE96596.1 serine/threonine protein phosphatase [Pseudomonas putida]